MAYIGNAPAIQSTEFREEFFPTSNQTAFITGGFHPSAVSVTRNGVLLSEADYTKGSDNVTITLVNAAVSGDVVVIRGNRSLAQGVSVSESRVEYTWQANDTVVELNADVIPAYTDVYLNGVKLAAADYSINASTKEVSFTSAPAVGDVIAVVHRNETSALVALPLKDSSGAEILSESGSTVTLANVDTATIGSNALVVDSSGNVGIGTNSPDEILHISGDTAEIKLTNTNPIEATGGTEQVFKIGVEGQKTNVYGPAGSIIFRQSGTWSSVTAEYKPTSIEFCTQDATGTDNSETPRVTIDSGGNVGVGTSPEEDFHVNGTDILLRSGSTGTACHIRTDGSNTYINNMDNFVSNGSSANGLLIFTGQGGFSFKTGSSGGSGTERMRIDSSGNLLVGYTSTNGSYKLQVNSQIFATSSTIATSDGRYKENIQPLDGGLAIVQALNPVQFDWKEHPVHQFDREQPTVGFIAQEVQEVLADKAYKNSIIKSNNTVITPEELDEDGNIITAEVTEEFLGITEGNLIAILTKAIQEQQSQIDALTARIEALEATP